MKPLTARSRASLADQGASPGSNPTRSPSARWVAGGALSFALFLGSFSFRLLQHLISWEPLPPWFWLIAVVTVTLTVCFVRVGIYLWRK